MCQCREQRCRRHPCTPFLPPPHPQAHLRDDQNVLLLLLITPKRRIRRLIIALWPGPQLPGLTGKGIRHAIGVALLVHSRSVPIRPGILVLHKLLHSWQHGRRGGWRAAGCRCHCLVQAARIAGGCSGCGVVATGAAKPPSHGRPVSPQLVEAASQGMLVCALVLVLVLFALPLQPPAAGAAGKSGEVAEQGGHQRSGQLAQQALSGLLPSLAGGPKG